MTYRLTKVEQPIAAGRTKRIGLVAAMITIAVGLLVAVPAGIEAYQRNSKGLSAELQPTDDRDALLPGESMALASSDVDHAFLRFDVGSFVGRSVEEAALRLYYSDSEPALVTVAVAQTNDWSEQTAVPKSQGDLNELPPVQRVEAEVAEAGFVSISVGSLIGELLPSDGLITFEVQVVSPDRQLMFVDSKEGHNSPALHIVVGEGPGTVAGSEPLAGVGGNFDTADDDTSLDADGIDPDFADSGFDDSDFDADFEDSNVNSDVDDSGFDDSGFDDSGFDDSGFDDSGFDDSGFDSDLDDSEFDSDFNSVEGMGDQVGDLDDNDWADQFDDDAAALEGARDDQKGDDAHGVDVELSADGVLIGPSTIPSKDRWGGAFRMRCSLGSATRDVLTIGNLADIDLQDFGSENLTEDVVGQLQRSDNSTCPGGTADRSLYWVTTLLDEAGDVAVPETTTVYYNRSGVDASTIAAPPRGLVTSIRGEDLPSDDATPRIVRWGCANKNSNTSNQWFTTLPSCDHSKDLLLWVRLPQCWDGKNLSLPGGTHLADFRDLLPAEDGNGNNYWGICPDSHPVSIPRVGIELRWSIGDGVDVSKWRLVTDERGQAPGSTVSAGSINLWNRDVQRTFVENCIKGGLSCNHDLGDGTKLISE